ncbi:acetate/propionate family kinase [Nonomuraea dietziae]|uniref:acetate/propionate family kinase n=1 Tax=Nonomuraea dietziae TaxID=65515 RepID=UPI0033C932FA
MSVLVLNTGSSSVKYELIEVESGERLANGVVERIGEDAGRLAHDGGAVEGRFADHEAALRAILDVLGDISPEAVGHRVVHGGEHFREAVLVDEGVIAAVERLAPLAPLHNPVNVIGIRVAQRAFPGVPQVAVFDTAFHHTIPPHAATYAVPPEWKVRRFGFHGTSCAYVAERASALLGSDLSAINLIVLHLGNGASATAVQAGRSVDTSMGLTPMEGLVMGTRSGDVDPGLAGYLARTCGIDADEALTRRSGLLALAGVSDMRTVRQRADEGDEAARLAREVYCHRIRKYVGAYYAVLGRVDAIIFTGGVGEHDAEVRAMSMAGLERLGVVLDPARNQAPSTGERAVSEENGEVAVLVIPTDEEWEIARQTLQSVRRGAPQLGDHA